MLAGISPSAIDPLRHPMPMNVEPMRVQPAHAAGPTSWAPLFLAWLTALLATAGALFLGEVMGKTPCVLCWYQRIAMFPLPLILGIGLLDRDVRSLRYALPLAWAGWAVALYHCLIYWGVISEALAPCSQGASCAAADVQVAGVVPIPLLSLLAFTGVLALLRFTRNKVKP